VIDPLTEDVLSLADAAKTLPARRGGKRPNISCLYRWTARGCRGVVLESIQIGATRCTSSQALARFFERLTAASKGEAPPVRTTAARQRAMAQAEAELAAAGL
jgi:hypothetical protein